MPAIASLIVFFALTFAAALFGAQFKPGEWYVALAKPTWTPPSWVFGPVWTLLYIMIAVAGWMVWRQRGFGPALVVWSVGLVLNALWSWLFFGQRLIGMALVDIVALWLTIVAFIAAAYPVSRTASFLFVPYLAWVSFATALNFAIWRLNG